MLLAGIRIRASARSFPPLGSLGARRGVCAAPHAVAQSRRPRPRALEICSPYRVSWHVDRACNMVSAKTLDNMCKVMKEVLVGPCRNQISRRDACSMAHPTHWLISTQDGHEEGPLPARLPRARRPQVGHGKADDAQAPRLGLSAMRYVACGGDAARGPPLMFCAPSFPFLSPLARR